MKRLKALETENARLRKAISDLTPERVQEIRSLREAGTTVPEVIRRTELSKASIYRALGR